jgi:Tfp pilus assembly protein PilO
MSLTVLRQWLLRHRAAWPHAAGALMLLAAVLLWATGQRPVAADNERLRAAATEAAQRPQAAAPATPAARFNAYEASLPRTAEAVDMVARIYRIGIANGLALPTGEYQLERVPDDRLLRYRLNLPADGSYPQVRAFILEVLDTLPAAVDDIQVRRESDGVQLRARLRFSLYLLPA